MSILVNIMIILTTILTNLMIILTIWKTILKTALNVIISLATMMKILMHSLQLRYFKVRLTLSEAKFQGNQGEQLFMDITIPLNPTPRKLKFCLVHEKGYISRGQ